jgi:uncharacterized membrane protein (UPF0127 family)
MTRRVGSLVIVVAAVVAIGSVACSSDADPTTDGSGGATSADESVEAGPTSTPSPTPTSTTGERAEPGVQPEGFTTIQALITEPDGEVCEVCLWLADAPDERARGLMGVTDLGDAVGMVFRFEGPTAGSFYMFQTPTPLSIAWFAADGSHVGSADMAPCLDTPAGECPLYSPGTEYLSAIEVFDGGLEPLGLVEGSSVELLEGTEADRCPVAS